jgi:streptogramin lyase
MQATSAGLWILDQKTNQVSLVSYQGKVYKTLETTSDRGSGMADDGVDLWLASTYSREILKIDRETGVTLAAFPTPGAAQTGAHGLEFHHGKLWVAVPPAATIYEIDVEDNFKIMRSIPAPGNRPHGIAWQGDDLWCVETNHRAIYRLNSQTGDIMAKLDIPVSYPEPHGMTLWEGYFWYCDAHSRAVCRLPLPGYL